MTVLVDTSVWIEFLRGTDSAATTFARGRMGDDLATTEPVLMELLAGAAPGRQLDAAERLLRGQIWISVDPRLDYRGAVDVFHAARSTGHQPRALADCLIAAIALRERLPVAHRDSDFEWIALATDLSTIDLRRATERSRPTVRGGRQ